MTSQQATKYAVEERAAWITLDSPQNRNALSVALVGELEGHLRTAVADPEVRTIVLTGNGPAFCAGADLKSRGDAVAPGSGRTNPFVEILKLMWEGPKPVIAAVNGHAFGGGIGLVAAADIAIAAEGSKFSFSEVRLGLIPAIISVVVLQKLGVHDAMRLFLTGDRFEATRAQRTVRSSSRRPTDFALLIHACSVAFVATGARARAFVQGMSPSWTA